MEIRWQRQIILAQQNLLTSLLKQSSCCLQRNIYPRRKARVRPLGENSHVYLCYIFPTCAVDRLWCWKYRIGPHYMHNGGNCRETLTDSNAEQRHSGLLITSLEEGDHCPSLSCSVQSLLCAEGFHKRSAARYGWPRDALNDSLQGWLSPSLPWKGEEGFVSDSPLVISLEYFCWLRSLSEKIALRKHPGNRNSLFSFFLALWLPVTLRYYQGENRNWFTQFSSVVGRFWALKGNHCLMAYSWQLCPVTQQWQRLIWLNQLVLKAGEALESAFLCVIVPVWIF